MKVVISKAHSKTVQGAKYFINEVDESIKVVDRVKYYMDMIEKNSCIIYEETRATTQQQNLVNIVNFHNSQKRDLDISIHFNSATFEGKNHTDKSVGCEVWYYSNDMIKLSENLVTNICKVSGLKNRGIKMNKNLYFLKNTSKPAILIELCFVNSSYDVDLYRKNFDKICKSIAETILGKQVPNKKETMYQVVCGTYSNKSNAEEQVKKLKSLNIDSFIQIKES